MASGIVGALAGAVIPAGVEGFDFALTALFAVLAFEAFQSSRDLSAPLIAGGLALAAAMSNYGLPDGVSLGMVAAVLIPVGIVTVLLRALPFSMLRVLKGSPFIDFLAVLMPVGVMMILVVYTLVGHAGSPAHLASALVALVATLLLHCWKRRADVPIFVGTALYMLLVNVVF